MSSYAHPEVLADTQWVAGHLAATKTRVVEVVYDPINYDSRYLPGAVGWSWSTDFQQTTKIEILKVEKKKIEFHLKRPFARYTNPKSNNLKTLRM